MPSPERTHTHVLTHSTCAHPQGESEGKMEVALGIPPSKRMKRGQTDQHCICHDKRSSNLVESLKIENEIRRSEIAMTVTGSGRRLQKARKARHQHNELQQHTCQWGSNTGSAASQPAVERCAPPSSPHPMTGVTLNAQLALPTVDDKLPAAPSSFATMAPAKHGKPLHVSSNITSYNSGTFGRWQSIPCLPWNIY